MTTQLNNLSAYIIEAIKTPTGYRISIEIKDPSTTGTYEILIKSTSPEDPNFAKLSLPSGLPSAEMLGFALDC